MRLMDDPTCQAAFLAKRRDYEEELQNVKSQEAPSKTAVEKVSLAKTKVVINLATESRAGGRSRMERNTPPPVSSAESCAPAEPGQKCGSLSTQLGRAKLSSSAPRPAFAVAPRRESVLRRRRLPVRSAESCAPAEPGQKCGSHSTQLGRANLQLVGSEARVRGSAPERERPPAPPPARALS